LGLNVDKADIAVKIQFLTAAFRSFHLATAPYAVRDFGCREECGNRWLPLPLKIHPNECIGEI